MAMTFAMLVLAGQIIQDLVLESKRNSRVVSKTEGTLASVEKKSQEMQNALDSSRAEVSRLKVCRAVRSSPSLLVPSDGGAHRTLFARC